MSPIEKVDWSSIKLIIFDVDGTLYTQSRMRKKMLMALLSYYMFRPWKLKELKILRDFRIEREKRPGFIGKDLENEQYEWCAVKGNYSVAEVKEVVNRWMFKFPNQYLANCTYPGTKSFFKTLKQMGFAIAIYSDYNAVDKLKAMELEADLIVSSTDVHINRLKPDPKAINYILDHFNLKPSECLFIGDREELDGQCAINAGCPYLIVDKKPFDIFDFYTSLDTELAQFTIVKKQIWPVDT